MKKNYLFILLIFIGIRIFSQDCSPIGWQNFQWPPSGITSDCNGYTVYAQVWKSGVTEAAGPSSTMSAWIGISTENSDPNTWPETRWHVAEYNVQVGNNDEYKYNIMNLPIGNYFIASRFKNDCSDYFYGGTTGPWNSNSATLTTTVNCSLSVEEYVNNSMSIFPNPSPDFITIHSLFELKNIEIYNLLGQEIKRNLSFGKRIDISTLPNGNYILKVVDNKDNKSVLKFIKN